MGLCCGCLGSIVWPIGIGVAFTRLLCVAAPAGATSLWILPDGVYVQPRLERPVPCMPSSEPCALVISTNREMHARLWAALLDQQSACAGDLSLCAVAYSGYSGCTGYVFSNGANDRPRLLHPWPAKVTQTHCRLTKEQTVEAAACMLGARRCAGMAGWSTWRVPQVPIQRVRDLVGMAASFGMPQS